MNDISIDNDDEPIDTSQVVVSINKEQYGCLVKLLSSPQYSYQPHYWTMTQPLVSWDELLTDEGQRIIWPICYRWLGPLRIGFLKEGVDCEELYEFLHDYYQTYSKSDNHPLSFLTFVHLGEGKFRLSIHQSLAKRDGIIKDTKAGNFKLRIDCTVGSSSVVTSSRRPSFNHKKAIFERFEEEIGSKEELLEKASSLGFHLELEKMICSMSRRMKRKGKNLNYKHLQSLLYKNTSSWQLNSLALNVIGKSLNEHIIRQCKVFVKK